MDLYKNIYSKYFFSHIKSPVTGLFAYGLKVRLGFLIIFFHGRIVPYHVGHVSTCETPLITYTKTYVCSVSHLYMLTLDRSTVLNEENPVVYINFVYNTSI